MSGIEREGRFVIFALFPSLFCSSVAIPSLSAMFGGGHLLWLSLSLSLSLLLKHVLSGDQVAIPSALSAMFGGGQQGGSYSGSSSSAHTTPQHSQGRRRSLAQSTGAGVEIGRKRESDKLFLSHSLSFCVM